MAKYNLDTRMEDVLADPAAMKILEKYLPHELLHHPMISMAKRHRLCTIYKYRQYADVSTELADKMLAELFLLD